MKKKIGIYIHIPFCVKKCNYCDFLSFPLCNEPTLKERYLEALLEEMEESKEYLKEYSADTVFIGGGTPSLLSGKEMEELLCKLRSAISVENDAEITLELNPGTAEDKKMQSYRNAGINRLSIGLQSANEKELKLLGRIHSFPRFLETYQMARECGFANINIDLMSGIPSQSMETYAETLNKVLALKPEHISAYSLIVEEGTPFYDIYGTPEGCKQLPGEELDRSMYAYTKKRFAEEDLDRYEISNYAEKGYECRHNIKYWKCDEYVGFGLGSASFFDKKRVKNPVTFETYLNSKQRKTNREVINLTQNDCMEEFVFLGLRMMEGVSKEEFFQRFHVDMETIYGDVLLKHQKQGLLIHDSNVRLTDKGIDVSNMVMADFLL